MPMYVVFKSYLSKLKEQESTKPKDIRRKVPTVKQIAKSIGRHQTTVNRIASNEVKCLNLETGGRIIKEMRKRGFDMALSDLVVYKDEEEIP